MADFSQLKTRLSGNIILPSENEKAYQQEVDETWNGAIRERKPAAFVRVATVEDVSDTVKFCVQNKVNRFELTDLFRLHCVDCRELTCVIRPPAIVSSRCANLREVTVHCFLNGDIHKLKSCSGLFGLLSIFPFRDGAQRQFLR